MVGGVGDEEVEQDSKDRGDLLRRCGDRIGVERPGICVGLILVVCRVAMHRQLVWNKLLGLSLAGRMYVSTSRTGSVCFDGNYGTIQANYRTTSGPWIFACSNTGDFCSNTTNYTSAYGGYHTWRGMAGTS